MPLNPTSPLGLAVIRVLANTPNTQGINLGPQFRILRRNGFNPDPITGDWVHSSGDPNLGNPDTIVWTSDPGLSTGIWPNAAGINVPHVGGQPQVPQTTPSGTGQTGPPMYSAATQIGQQWGRMAPKSRTKLTSFPSVGHQHLLNGEHVMSGRNQSAKLLNIIRHPSPGETLITGSYDMPGIPEEEITDWTLVNSLRVAIEVCVTTHHIWYRSA